MDKNKEKLKVLASLISLGGRIIAKDNINKDYIVGDNPTGSIIVTSDSGYEAIYIGNTKSGNTDGYMCLYTNNTPNRNSFPSTKELTELLCKVLNKEKLETGEGKAAYYDWKEFGGLDKQLCYFSKVVSELAGITKNNIADELNKRGKKAKKTMNGFNPDKLTYEGCCVYMSSWVETLQDRISQGDPRALLYEEQITFLQKAIEGLEKLKK